MFLTPPNKSKALHYLRLDSGVLRIVYSRRADCAKCFCFLGGAPSVPAASSWLDFPLHRVGANSPESKLLEGGHAPDQATGRALSKAPLYETGKPPVARLLSGAACCQAAIRYCSCHGYFRSCLSINSLGYCSVSQAFIGRPSEIAE